jgi:hypothetical protein
MLGWIYRQSAVIQSSAGAVRRHTAHIVKWSRYVLAWTRAAGTASSEVPCEASSIPAVATGAGASTSGGRSPASDFAAPTSLLGVLTSEFPSPANVYGWGTSEFASATSEFCPGTFEFGAATSEFAAPATELPAQAAVFCRPRPDLPRVATVVLSPLNLTLPSAFFIHPSSFLTAPAGHQRCIRFQIKALLNGPGNVHAAYAVFRALTENICREQAVPEPGREKNLKKPLDWQGGKARVEPALSKGQMNTIGSFWLPAAKRLPDDTHWSVSTSPALAARTFSERRAPRVPILSEVSAQWRDPHECALRDLDALHSLLVSRHWQIKE